MRQWRLVSWVSLCAALSLASASCSTSDEDVDDAETAGDAALSDAAGADGGDAGDAGERGDAADAAGEDASSDPVEGTDGSSSDAGTDDDSPETDSSTTVGPDVGAETSRWSGLLEARADGDGFYRTASLMIEVTVSVTPLGWRPDVHVVGVTLESAAGVIPGTCGAPDHTLRVTVSPIDWDYGADLTPVPAGEEQLFELYTTEQLTRTFSNNDPPGCTNGVDYATLELLTQVGLTLSADGTAMTGRIDVGGGELTDAGALTPVR